MTEKRYEYCWICDDLTGRAGRADGSLYCEICEEGDLDGNEHGPFCEECWRKHQHDHPDTEAAS